MNQVYCRRSGSFMKVNTRDIFKQPLTSCSESSDSEEEDICNCLCHFQIKNKTPRCCICHKDRIQETNFLVQSFKFLCSQFSRNGRCNCKCHNLKSEPVCCICHKASVVHEPIREDDSDYASLSLVDIIENNEKNGVIICSSCGKVKYAREIDADFCGCSSRDEKKEN
ncbi:hypothetical protein NPIL_583071 [Nephila pilipes]|uniref:Uncharacterized protein n=1 Tax=Nephila pilipes TaxID=299642 RepID=A0A8X6PDM1_NEPPI|nr:hypothetical protein NPIL_583071 [Nephila pilipes]